MPKVSIYAFVNRYKKYLSEALYFLDMNEYELPPIRQPMELLQFYRMFGPESKRGIKLRQTIDIFLTKSEQAIKEGNEELKSYFQKKYLAKSES